jgi:predicted alpha/beta-hydrolase family hydrolase
MRGGPRVRQTMRPGRSRKDRPFVSSHPEQDVQLAAATRAVSGILIRPPDARALYVFAHGAGAGMRHAYMSATAQALADVRIATLRYQFPYTEIGGKRPDPPVILEGTVRKVVQQAAALTPGLPLLAGGKSMGGRMTSQAAASEPLPGVAGLVFFGFPLHAPGAPGTTRAEHLTRVSVPMLFLQGTRDSLAQLSLMEGVCAALPGATLHIVDGADHSFAVPRRSGRTPEDVRAEMMAAVTAWLDSILG